MMRDNDFGIVRARAFGTYDFKITDPKLFLKEVAGSDQHFRLDEFADTMRSRIVSAVQRSARAGEDSGARRGRALQRSRRGAAAADQSGDDAKYGLELTSFILENVSLPPEVEAGDRQAFVDGRGRQSERLREIPNGAGHGHRAGGGAGGFATEMAVGMAMAQQMMQQQGGVLGPQATPPVGAPLPGQPHAADRLRHRRHRRRPIC